MKNRLMLALLLVATACERHAPLDATVPDGWRFPIHVPATTAPHGMAVSDSPIAAHVGETVLAAGGNAVDAAVAMAFTLAVVYPEAGNLGGGGFAVVRTAAGQDLALDFREMAPGASTADMFLDANGAPTSDSLQGHRASGVPGSVAGLFALHHKLGKKPWAEVVAPAIALARDGVLVDANFAAAIADEQARLAKVASSATLFLPEGKPPAVGSTWKDPELAAVLGRIAAQGPPGFYEGETAALIVAEMQRGGGIITADDLKGYEPKWRTPLEFDYRGDHVIAMPLPSSGGTCERLIAKMLERMDLKRLGWHSTAHLHFLAEAERRAFADRNAYLGDPDFTPAHPELLTDAYAARRAATIDPTRATPSSQVQPGDGAVPGDKGQTTHLAVVDADGNVVALTTTLNLLFGSAVTVSGAGFLLNDEMDDFTSKPGAPNAYGLVMGVANAIAPRKRPLSAMSPTIVLGADGKVLLVAGGRGGSRIISGTFQVLSNVVDFGMDVSAAVRAPRIHHQYLPDTLFYEPAGLPEAQLRELTGLGYVMKIQDPIAVTPAIEHTAAGWEGAGDPRRVGAAEGL